jgi:hypothetical protein
MNKTSVLIVAILSLYLLISVFMVFNKVPSANMAYFAYRFTLVSDSIDYYLWWPVYKPCMLLGIVGRHYLDRNNVVIGSFAP